MHISSLPGPFGIGDLGYEAYAFADFLLVAGQTIWQILPIVPVGHGYSPYSSPSTFAGNTLFISPDLLLEDGLLAAADLAYPNREVPGSVNFESASKFKRTVLKTAWDRFAGGGFSEIESELQSFKGANHDWLTNFALFEAIKEVHGGQSWTEWPASLRDRELVGITDFALKNGDLIEMIMFHQFLFDRQWRALRSYCHERHIALFGDLPIYVAQDSADVWANRNLFFLDNVGLPEVVSGVPPDYFSETGQRWGNPLYNWEVMKTDEYSWWVSRMKRVLGQVDLVRLDHFRAFEAYWEVPASEETAIHGQWTQGPGADLFETLTKQLGTLPVIAENLGVITNEVTHLMDAFGFPGMAILQFAFNSGPENAFLPHNYSEDIVAYTGTHDNDTLLGWWTDSTSTDSTSTQSEDEKVRERSYCAQYLCIDLVKDAEKSNSSSHMGETGQAQDFTWKAIRSLMASRAKMVVTPVQDILTLGSHARMNTPGTSSGNWGWRLEKRALTPEIAAKLAALTLETDRKHSV